MKTKNILRTLLMAVTLLLGAEQAQADTKVWEGSVVGGTCWDNYGGNEGSFTISNTKFASAKAGDKLRVKATLNANDGSNGKWMFYIASNGWYSNLKFSDWHGSENEKQFSKDNPNNFDVINGYFEFTLTDESLEPMAGSAQGGIRIHFLGLTITEVWLITGGSTPVNPPVGPTTYTITYMVNGAVYTTQNYAAGASISLPAQPTMEGFSFVGWDGMPTNLIMPDQSITVTAMWSAASYDVSASYNSQFGAVSINNTGNDFTTAQAGSTVYVTCTPYSGYYVQSVSLNTGGTVSGSDNSYSFTMPTQAVTVYVTFVAGTVNAPITSTTQLATFSSTYALDFSDVTALKAYIVTGTNNGYAILEQVTGTVAPNTGLIIYGATADIPIALSGDTKSSNKLIATTTDTNVSGSGNYVLSVKSGDAVFAETSTASANVPANHAYLHLGGASARRFITIKVSNETTGINSIEAEGNAIEQTFYNLNGQRVETPTRGGIYIVNGKKVLMK